MMGWRSSLDHVLTQEPDPHRDCEGTCGVCGECLTCTSPHANCYPCTACGGPVEPLLEYEMVLGARADTDLCRGCHKAA